MALSSPSTKLLTVVHSGPLLVVARGTSHTTQQPVNDEYDLHGEALDVCRHVISQTLRMSEPHNIRITKDAVVNDVCGAWESLLLVPDCACIVVGKMIPLSAGYVCCFKVFSLQCPVIVMLCCLSSVCLSVVRKASVL